MLLFFFPATCCEHRHFDIQIGVSDPKIWLVLPDRAEMRPPIDDRLTKNRQQAAVQNRVEPDDQPDEVPRVEGVH